MSFFFTAFFFILFRFGGFAIVVDEVNVYGIHWFGVYARCSSLSSSIIREQIFAYFWIGRRHCNFSFQLVYPVNVYCFALFPRFMHVQLLITLSVCVFLACTLQLSNRILFGFYFHCLCFHLLVFGLSPSCACQKCTSIVTDTVAAAAAKIGKNICIYQYEQSSKKAEKKIKYLKRSSTRKTSDTYILCDVASYSDDCLSFSLFWCVLRLSFFLSCMENQIKRCYELRVKLSL